MSKYNPKIEESNKIALEILNKYEDELVEFIYDYKVEKGVSNFIDALCQWVSSFCLDGLTVIGGRVNGLFRLSLF